MAKKSVGGTGKGLIGGSGVTGTITAKNYGGKLISNSPTAITGGLGVQAYSSPKFKNFLSTRRTTTTGIRNKLYGGAPTAITSAPAPKPMARIPTANPRKIANEIMALRQRAPKANAGAQPPIKAKVAPADSNVIRTTVNMKNSPTPKRGTNLGVSSGKTTGKTVSRGGTGGRTTGGGRAAGGGYTNAGPAGPGASGRGTGGKR